MKRIKQLELKWRMNLEKNDSPFAIDLAGRTGFDGFWITYRQHSKYKKRHFVVDFFPALCEMIT